jgi:hypothetical protein
MPPLIGLLFPIGWLPFELVARLYFLSSIISLGAIAWQFGDSTRTSAIQKTLLLLLICTFSPTVTHITFGQIAVQTILLLTLAVIYRKAFVWSALFCVLALAKPHLSFLVIPGLLISIFGQNEYKAALQYIGAVFAWTVISLVPLFAFYPNCIPNFAAALCDNPTWAQPFTLVLFQS